MLIIKKIKILCGMVGLAGCLAGCGPGGSVETEEYLIRSGEQKVTAREFLQALEIAKAAYPDGLEPAGRGIAEARAILLEEMATELVLLRRAAELGLSVPDDQLEAAVAAIMADYPPGVFEQTLVESAVSLNTWKKRLQVRLLMEKVMEADLQELAVVTAEEVAVHYDRHYRGRAAAAGSEDEFQRLKESIVADVRRQKLEDTYGGWIRRLRERFPVEINPDAWGRLREPPGGS
jgi:parvulin-like peptidyl-prolyl isomerase